MGNEDCDQIAHLYNLITAFIVHLQTYLILQKVSMNNEGPDQSAQNADHGLYCSLMTKEPFSHGVSDIFVVLQENITANPN